MNGHTHAGVLVGVLCLLVVAGVRGGFLISRFDSLSGDPDAYRVIAETLARTGVFGLPTAEIADAEIAATDIAGTDIAGTDIAGVGNPNALSSARPTAFRPPLYPWLLSWFVGEDGRLSNLPVAVLHGLIGVLTVVVTWDIARRWLSPRAALLAGGLVLIDPILLWQSTLVMTESLATLLVVVAWWWWVVRIGNAPCSRTGYIVDSVVLGGWLLLAILCRPTFVVWAAMLLMVMLLLAGLRSDRVGRVGRVGRITGALAAGVVVAAGVGTWTWRNVAAVGHPVWGTTHGGYTLLLANNDSFYDYLQHKEWQLPWQNTAWEPSVFFAAYELLPRSGDEYADDRVAYDAAKATIAARPGMFWYSSWTRLVRLWQPFPHATADRSAKAILAVGMFHGIVYLLVFLAAIRHRRALWSRAWREWIPLWPAIALVITLSGVHAVYWSNPRMRSPAIPAIAIAGAAVLTQLNSKRNQGFVTDHD